MQKSKEPLPAVKQYRSVAGTQTTGSHGKTMPAPLQRKVIPHQTFLNNMEREMYKDDTTNIKVSNAWGAFEHNTIYQQVNQAPLNVYVTSTGKDTAAYIRTAFDAENFKDHVGALVYETAKDKKVDAVVNFNMAQTASGLDLSKSAPLLAAGDGVSEKPAPSKMPFYYVMTHEFGHVLQYLGSGKQKFEELLQSTPKEVNHADLHPKFLEMWLSIVMEIKNLAEGSPEKLMKNTDIFKWMLLSDIIDGYLMRKNFMDQRTSLKLITWYLNIPIEYDNIIRHEISPALFNESMDYASFPVRTEHGIERQVEFNLKEGKTEEKEVGATTADEEKKEQLRTTQEPFSDVTQIMTTRLGAISLKMMPVFDKHIQELKTIMQF